MHNQEIVQLKFDPSKSEKPVIREIFSNRIATILWCSIKSCHVVDQYFNDKVLEVSKGKGILTDEYDEFLRSCVILTNQFGRTCVSESLIDVKFEIDHEFWGDIFKAINGKRCFRLEIN